MKKQISRRQALRAYLAVETNKGRELTCVGSMPVIEREKHGKSKVVNIGRNGVLVVQLHEHHRDQGGNS